VTFSSAIQFDESGVVSCPDLNSPVGTADYMAPEVIAVYRNKKNHMTRDAIYGVWALLYTTYCATTIHSFFKITVKINVTGIVEVTVHSVRNCCLIVFVRKSIFFLMLIGKRCLAWLKTS